ncbi:hypothetical protein A6P39_040235 [Streptomyces sp. FXJ1.172]|uniref:hypothetical protein n=1 Tax=Streptomyces sp. FXJ1.172 TaxID=710705 RepID=UPI0007CF24B4|nr:hypothetical protein [Streptomyces sp. FXJ1.172]WEO99777.1 hypothetical protein A6P39_040235 [Streptomyces sp. FXJ1.172]
MSDNTMSHNAMPDNSMPGDEEGAAHRVEPVTVSRSGDEVHYHFPIHVVMVGDVEEETKSEIEARIWNALYDAMG